MPAGDVDERSIAEVEADELRGYSQCHFFAGIGGWPLALRLAGVDPEVPLWTGSCPCQPYSVAGKRKGTTDDRHLWPVWFQLIKAAKPLGVLGEQVEGAVKHGWLDGVFADLEAEGYACGAVVLGAHSVGAPHIRQRIFWVADAGSGRIWNDGLCPPGGASTKVCGEVREQRIRFDVGPSGGAVALGLADAEHDGGRLHESERKAEERVVDGWSGAGLQSAWSDCGFVDCRDGKARRIESGTFPLVDGIPGRVGLLRGYGNAIVPQAAAEFIKAWIETRAA